MDDDNERVPEEHVANEMAQYVMDAENAAQAQNALPVGQEGPQAEPVPEVVNNEENVRDFDDINDDFDQQMDRLAQQILHPIDENEVGFPQYLNFLDNHPIPEQEVQPLAVMPPLPMFERFTRPENRLPPLHDPNNLKRALDQWEQPKRQEYLDQLIEHFPELFEEEVEERPIEAIGGQIGEPIGGQVGVGQQMVEKKKVSVYEMIDEENEGIVHRLDAQTFQQRLIEEQEEYEQLLQQTGTKRETDSQKTIQLYNILNSGLKNYNENEALMKIRRLMSGKVIEEESSRRAALPSVGKAHINQLNDDELTILFKVFTFQGQFVLSEVCLLWKQLMRFIFEKQHYLWFSNEERNQKRFLPIEDCCESCHKRMDSEPVIRVIAPNLLQAISNDVLSLTPNLLCLRLYRFAFNNLLVVKTLHENCPQLKHLDLTECFDLRQVVIKELAIRYPNLKHLIVCSTNFDERMLSSLAPKMKCLETLVMSSTLINGQSLVSLPKSLKRLDIRCCPNLEFVTIRDFLQKSLKSLTELQFLKIDCYKSKQLYDSIGDNLSKSLIHFEVNESVKHIYGAQNYISEPVLQKLKDLQTLKFGKNIAFNSNLFRKILNNCKNIRSFSMEVNSVGQIGLTEADLNLISTSWPLLERLEIMKCKFVGKAFLQSLQQSSNLNYLNLTQCSELYDEFTATELLRLTKVNYLVLDKCHNLSKRTLDSAIIKANRMSYEIFRVSMLRCNFTNLPYLKGKLVPNNLRITYSSLNAKRYVTFDGNRTKYGKMTEITDFLNGK